MNRFLPSPDCTSDEDCGPEIEIQNEEDAALESRASKLLAMYAKNDALRVKLAARFRRENEPGEAEKLENCNQPLFLRCSDCQHQVKARTACRRRWCPVCARVLAARRVAKYEKAAALMKWGLHVTLTVTNKQALGLDDLRQLLRHFKKLRRTVLWTRSVLGGFVALEITNKGKGWHPHLHILCDCEWLAYKTPPPMRWHSKERKAELYAAAAVELHDTWCGIVGQKVASIKVRRCAASDAIREVLKYAVKGSEMLEFKGRAADVVAAMKHTRLSTPFGSMYGRGKETEPDKPAPCACAECGAIGSMMPEEVLARFVKNDARKAPIDRRASR